LTTHQEKKVLIVVSANLGVVNTPTGSFQATTGHHRTQNWKEMYNYQTIIWDFYNMDMIDITTKTWKIVKMRK